MGSVSLRWRRGRARHGARLASRRGPASRPRRRRRRSELPPAQGQARGQPGRGAFPHRFL